MRWRLLEKVDITNAENRVRLCCFANTPVGHMLAMQVNQLTVVWFPSLPSNRVAGLEPPPPHLLTPVSGTVSKHQQACARCVRGNESKGGCCCERAGRRRSERMENREESGVCVCVGWLVRDEHCLAGSTPAFAGIIHALGGAQRLCSQTG